MELITKSYSSAMSDDITKLATAFLLAKKAFIKLDLNGRNDHQKFDYARLNDIYKAVEEGLTEQNIWITHWTRPQDSGLEYIYTRLIHAPTGQFIEDSRILQPDKPGCKDRGAAETYMKKYAVLSLCSIAPSHKDDVDAQQESKGPELLVFDEVKYLQSEIKSASNPTTLHNNILKVYKVQSLSQLPFSMYESVKDYIANNKG